MHVKHNHGVIYFHRALAMSQMKDKMSRGVLFMIK